MTAPKRRQSATRGRKRRTHWKVHPPALSICPSCGKPKLSHFACPHCGFYKGRVAIQVK
ncbi:MAG: 50S ribosomal protein L32 [Candidatus Caldipriscus sp.]|jgi:large subunit ribosomal protein L32|nr:50S ribosomal protein L32 [Candidatus Caldipriscus sp.]